MYRSGNKDEYDIIYDYDRLDIEERIIYRRIRSNRVLTWALFFCPHKIHHSL